VEFKCRILDMDPEVAVESIVEDLKRLKLV
jgi:hypothetical protein